MNSETGYVDNFLNQISEDYRSDVPKIDETDMKIIFGLTFAAQCPSLKGTIREIKKSYELVIKKHQETIGVNYFFDKDQKDVWLDAREKTEICRASEDALDFLQRMYVRTVGTPLADKIKNPILSTIINCGDSSVSSKACGRVASNVMEDTIGLLKDLEKKYGM